MKKFMFCLFLVSFMNCSFAGKNLSKLLPNNQGSEKSEEDLELGSLDAQDSYASANSSDDTEEVLNELSEGLLSEKIKERMFVGSIISLTLLTEVIMVFTYLEYIQDKTDNVQLKTLGEYSVLYGFGLIDLVGIVWFLDRFCR